MLDIKPTSNGLTIESRSFPEQETFILKRYFFFPFVLTTDMKCFWASEKNKAPLFYNRMVFNYFAVGAQAITTIILASYDH